MNDYPNRDILPDDCIAWLKEKAERRQFEFCSINQPAWDSPEQFNDERDKDVRAYKLAIKMMKHAAIA